MAGGETPFEALWSKARHCAIHTSTGERITGAEAAWGGPGWLAILKSESRGALLGYFFGKGGREVRIYSGPFVMPGRLATRWDGDRSERLWWVELNLQGQPVESQPRSA